MGRAQPTGSHLSCLRGEGSRKVPSGTCPSQVGYNTVVSGGPCCSPWEDSGQVDQSLLQYQVPWRQLQSYPEAVAKANELTHAKPWAHRPCLIKGPLLLLLILLFPCSH